VPEPRERKRARDPVEEARTVERDLPEPRVSVPSHAFARPFAVELADPSGRREIRYTLDGSDPTSESALYSRPIRIAGTVQLAARIFGDGSASGPTARRSYLRVDGDVERFRSEIPVVLIETFGEGIPRYRDHRDAPMPYVRSILHVVEPEGDGACRAGSPASFSGWAGIRARGSSTLGREKASLTVEIRDHAGEDLDVPLLGLPAESDWVLLGPLEFDRALMRNALVYAVSRQMGRYAPRTRFVELFLNEDGGPVGGPVPDGRDYYGVYVLVEKIKRGKERVEIESMSPQEVGGGYILKVDRPGPGDYGFHSGGQTFHYVYPKEIDVSPAQAAWIEGYLGEFHAALRSASFSEPDAGYGRYLDIDAAVDYHIINEFTKNPDSYVYSAYFHKARDGKLTLGPVWDFDRTMGCDHDRRARNPHGWSRNAFRFWYGRLFDDAEFRDRYRRRWSELRGGPFDEAHLMGLIDGMAKQIDGAAERNTVRWGSWTGLQPGEWRREVGDLRRWIQQRLEWYDRAVAALPD
jgi:hypothetical protein